MADDKNIQIILRKQPDMLKVHGIDPDELKAELEASKQMITQVENEYDTVMKPTFTLLWENWVVQYKQALNDLGSLPD